MIYSSEKLRNEIQRAVQAAESGNKIVDISAIVDSIFKQDDAEGLPRAEIEQIVLAAALQKGCAVEFRQKTKTELDRRECAVLEIELIRDPADTN